MSAFSAIQGLHNGTVKKGTFNQVTHQPPNKKVTPQRSFFLTKSKSKRPTVRLAKPTQKEKEHIKELLDRKELHVYSQQIPSIQIQSKFRKVI